MSETKKQRFWEIILEFGYVYADDEDAAWAEANRLLNNNSSVDFTLKEKTNAECDLERAAPDLLAFACDVMTGYDHDEDAHRYKNGTCRACNAEKVIKKATGEK